VAVGRDANDSMYPIAQGLRLRENREMWTCFYGLLKKDLNIGTGEGWTIIFD